MEYASNSHKSREKKKIEKVISGAAKSKKKNEITKFADVFISEDVRTVKSYILMDVLVPAVKKAVSDIITNGIDMLLYGGDGRSKNGSAASKISYGRYYEREHNRRGDHKYLPARNSYSYDDVILTTRGEAEEVLSRMDELISTYGSVSVADLYDLVGITETNGNYTDNYYGWTNIRSAVPVRVREGYLLKLPKALSLD